MRKLRRNARFKRDVRRMKKRGKDIGKLQAIVKKLLARKSLTPHHRRHRLKGGMAHCWECHIEPDWLLVWEENDRSVTLIRTGTHEELF